MCPATSSGLKSADAAIMAMPGKLCGVILLADGTNAASLVLYDDAAGATGTVLAKLSVDATATESNIQLPISVVANKGIYANVEGTGAEYIVYFQQG